MLDLRLTGALICDGTEEKPFMGQVGIKDGKIVQVATVLEQEAAEELDLSGLVLSPGFIDIHSHSDGSYLQDDRCQAKIYQGVTSEVTGQCGSSLFPRNQHQLSQLEQGGEMGDAEPGDAFQSASFEKLRARVEAEGRRMSTNLVQLVGHNSIRRGVVGLGGRASSEDEIALSAHLLDQNLAQGAWGLSLGLGYMPGIFADMKELVALGKVCAKYDALITSHMRYEDHRVFEAVEEMIELSRRTGARVHIAHLKLASKQLWGQAERLYTVIQNAVQEGIPLTADMYPYNASSTGITNVLPEWAMEGGTEGAFKRLTTPGPEKDKLYAHLCENYPDPADGDRVYIVSTGGRYPAADGKTMRQLSEELGLSVPDTLMKALTETACQASGIFFSMDLEDVYTLLAKDIAIGSDGSGRPYDPAMNDGKPHPRAYGTFARFLRLRREHDLCSLETAIHRMTQKPAQILGLGDRGLIKPGYVADLTAFDPDRVSDNATFDNPFQKPDGICHVLMNGRFAIRNGEQTEERLGSYLIKKA